jgi:hypothetical protein
MPGTATNVVNEPVWVLYGDAIGSLTNLGYTAKGSDVTVNIGQNWIPQMVAQTGEMPIEMYDNGQTIEVTIEFAEVVNWDLWPEVFSMSEKQDDDTTATWDRIVSHSESAVSLVGTKGTDNAKMLVLRPIELYTDATTETARDFVIPQAVCTNVGEIPFGIDNPQILPVTFTGIGDPAASDGEVLWYRGRTTGTWTAE